MLVTKSKSFAKFQIADLSLKIEVGRATVFRKDRVLFASRGDVQFKQAINSFIDLAKSFINIRIGSLTWKCNYSTDVLVYLLPYFETFQTFKVVVLNDCGKEISVIHFDYLCDDILDFVDAILQVSANDIRKIICDKSTHLMSSNMQWNLRAGAFKNE